MLPPFGFRIKVPLVSCIFCSLAFLLHPELVAKSGDATTPSSPTPVTDHRDLASKEAKTSEIVKGLDAPWGLVWLPDGDILVTERFGSLRLIKDGKLVAEPISGVPQVYAAGQGGLLDVSLHPNFKDNRFVYLSYSDGNEEGNRLRVVRAKLDGMSLQNPEIIFEVAQTKTGGNHYGSRFQWLPDGTLLISSGDGGNPPIEYGGKLIREQAQYLTSHLGKVIRINDDGSIPEDNPFAGRPDVQPEIWSYGHRNIQGIAYDPVNKRLFASEHGSKGGDELNLLLAGANYGWPLATHSTEYNAAGTPISPNRSIPDAEDPIAVWTPSIAPSGMVYYSGDKYGDWKGDLFLAAMILRSDETIQAYRSRPAGSVIRIETDTNGKVTGQELINVGEVRVRDIEQGPNGFLYALVDTISRQRSAGKFAGKLIRIEPRE